MKKILHGFLLMLEVVFAEHYFCENPKAVCCNAAGNSCPADGKTLLASPRSGFDRCGAVCHAPVKANDLNLTPHKSPGPHCPADRYCCTWLSAADCPDTTEPVGLEATHGHEGCDLTCSASPDALMKNPYWSKCSTSALSCKWMNPLTDVKRCTNAQVLQQTGKGDGCRIRCEKANSDELCCSLSYASVGDACGGYFENVCGLARCSWLAEDQRPKRQSKVSKTVVPKGSNDKGEESKKKTADDKTKKTADDQKKETRNTSSTEELVNADVLYKKVMKDFNYTDGTMESKMKLVCDDLFANVEKFYRNTDTKGVTKKKKDRPDQRINLASIYRAMRKGTAANGCNIGFPDHYAVGTVAKRAGSTAEFKGVRPTSLTTWFYYGKRGCEKIKVEDREATKGRNKEGAKRNGTKREKIPGLNNSTNATNANATNALAPPVEVGDDEMPLYRFVKENNSLWNLFVLESDAGMYFSVQVVLNRDLDKKCTGDLQEVDGECVTPQVAEAKEKKKGKKTKETEEEGKPEIEFHYTFWNLTVLTCANSDPCQHGKCVNKEEGTKNKPMITECDCLLEFGKEDCSEEKKHVINHRLLYLASPFLAIIGIAVVVALITIICCDRGNRKERGYKPKWRKTIGVMAPDVLATLPPEAQAQQKRLETEAAAKAAQEDQEEAEAPPEW